MIDGMHRRHLLWSAAAAPGLARGADTPVGGAIRALLMTQQEAWNRGDIPAFMTAYWKSPELAFIGASIARGWDGTLQNYYRRYPARAAMGTLTFSDLEVHEVGKQAAWVFGRFALARTAEGGGAASGKFTLVLRKFKDGWKIVLDHTSA